MNRLCKTARRLPSQAFKSRQSSSKATSNDLSDPRWLYDVQARLGRCINFGLDSVQIHEAGWILKELAENWRALLAGVEGFLTGSKRAGLLRQSVVWGELDSMGHVNNVVFNRWAESGRVEWIRNFARTFDVQHARQWRELWTPEGDGLILKSIKTDFKFVSNQLLHLIRYYPQQSILIVANKADDIPGSRYGFAQNSNSY